MRIQGDAVRAVGIHGEEAADGFPDSGGLDGVFLRRTIRFVSAKIENLTAGRDLGGRVEELERR